MKTNPFLKNVEKIAADLLTGEQVSVVADGEDYYTVEVLSVDGRKSNFPPVWLPSSASDRQIKEKLSHEFDRQMYPDAGPDDLAVPNLLTEGRQLKVRR